jgi:hypothetical protein
MGSYYTLRFGSLADGDQDVARAVVDACHRRPLVIWVDHRDRVFGDVPARAKDAPLDWIVGSYRADIAAADVAEDLAAFRCSRGPL